MCSSDLNGVTSASAARRRSCDRVNTPPPGTSVAVLFPVVAFFGGMTGEGDDADADAHERNSRAPYLARQMSWCRNQDTGGSTPPGSYVDGASRALL